MAPRVYSKTGCEQCRERKKKCDEVQPVCSACVRLQLPCSWVPSKKYKGRLKSDVPSPNPLGRSGTQRNDYCVQDRPAKRCHAQHEYKTAEVAKGEAQSSEARSVIPARIALTAASLLTENGVNRHHVTVATVMRSFFELELHARYTNAYPIQHPADVFFTVDEGVVNLQHRPVHLIRRYECIRALQLAQYSSRESPLEVPLYSESLLRMQIRRWTQVEISDHLAERAFSAYFQTEHPLLGLFDAEQFLSDLASGPTSLCSPLLVNSILFYACKRFSCVDTRASQISRLFFKEAKKILNNRQRKTAITDVAALHFLSAGRVIDCEDDAGFFLAEALKVGDEYQLYGAVSHSLNLTEFKSPQEKTAYMYAAWGSFGCSVYQAFFCQTDNLRDPPMLPIPVPRMPQMKEGTSYQESLEEIYRTNIFATICRFWIIIRDAILTKRIPQSAETSMRSMCNEMIYRRLLEWTEKLPEDFIRTAEMSGSVAIVWSWFHHSVMEIFQSSTEVSTRGFSTFSAFDGSPRAVFESSFRQLARTVLAFRSNNLQVRLTLFWKDSLYYLSKTLVLSYSGLDAPMLFYHCVLGIIQLKECFLFADDLLRDVLRLAVKSNRLNADTASLIFKEAQLNLESHLSCFHSSNLEASELHQIRKATESFKAFTNDFESYGPC